MHVLLLRFLLHVLRFGNHGMLLINGKKNYDNIQFIFLCYENSRVTENNLWMDCMGKESSTSYEFCCVLTGECKDR